MQRPPSDPAAPVAARRKKHRRGGQALSPTGANASRQNPAPERQCIACRGRKPQPRLLQLAELAEGLLAPAGRPVRGKAFYVCVDRTCLTQVAKRGPDADGWLAGTAVLASQRFVAMLGLARRQGQLLVGAARIVERALDADGFDVYAAADAAARTRHKLGEAASTCMLTGEALGRAVGAREVAAVGVSRGLLGERAAYWLQVWYEARRLDTEPATLGSTPNRRRIEVAR